MPVDTALVVPPSRVNPRQRTAREALVEAERRGAPAAEIRILEEAAIAACVVRVRTELRVGLALTAAERNQYERDQELLRRFPENRRGMHGGGWFHLQ